MINDRLTIDNPQKIIESHSYGFLLIHLPPGHHLQLLRRHLAQRHSHRAADHGVAGAGGSAAETQRKGLLGKMAGKAARKQGEIRGNPLEMEV